MSVLPTISLAQLRTHVIEGLPLIDVRAPIEFNTGAIPGSVNLPILDTDERAVIGTCYKQHGQEKAIALGYRMVSGENKEAKVQKWQQFIRENPAAIVTCFRGGQRSQITQKFLLEAGVEVARLGKGYKQARQYFLKEIEDFSANKEMILLTGLTGSAKTVLLNHAAAFYPTVDLEELASHRGSAFGERGVQPAQANFENGIATALMRVLPFSETRPVLMEDESRLIGGRHLPERFFDRLRASKVIVVQQTLEERIEHILKEYVVDANPSVNLFLYFENALKKIEKRLGGLKTQEILADLRQSRHDFIENRELNSNRVWIEKLLVHYYDRLYAQSFEKRNPEILFRGNHGEVLDFLKSLS